MRKIISVALTAVMLLSLLSFGFSAAANAVSVIAADFSTRSYDTLAAALADYKAGETLTLNDDITEDVTFPADAELEGNGHTLNGQIVVKAADGLTNTYVTVRNLKINNTAGAEKGAVSLQSTCRVQIENCEITSKDFAIFPLDNKAPDSEITVKNCTLNAGKNSQVFYAKDSQTWNLEDCVLTSPEQTDRASIQTKGSGAKVTLKNCTVSNNCKFCIACQVDTDEFTLIGGSFTTTGGENPTIRVAGKLTIDGTAVKSTVTNAISTYSSVAAIDIQNATVEYAGGGPVSAVDASNGSVEIHSGVFKSNGKVAIVSGPAAFVYSATFENTGDNDIKAFETGRTGELEVIEFPTGQKTVTVQDRVKPETTPAPETTRKPVTTKDPSETKKPVQTQAPATATAAAAPGDTVSIPEKSGCGSAASLIAVAVLALGMTEIIRKKD